MDAIRIKQNKINYHTSPFGIGFTSCLCFSMLYIVSIAWRWENSVWSQNILRAACRTEQWQNMATIHFNSLVLAHLQNRWPIITQGCGAEWDETIYPLSLYLCMALLGVDADMGWLSSCNPNSLHDRTFMRQAGRTRYFARNATRAQSVRWGEEKNKTIFLFSSSRTLRSAQNIAFAPLGS